MSQHGMSIIQLCITMQRNAGEARIGTEHSSSSF